MKKIKIAVCGTGFGADTIIPVLNEFRNIEITAIAGGKDRAKTELAAKRHGIPCWEMPYEKLMAEKAPDLVFIASPHQYHYEMAKQAIDKDLHIVCEKPLGCSNKEVGCLAGRPNKNHKLRLINHQLPFLPDFELIKSTIDNGGIGKLYFIRINFETDRLIRPGTLWGWCFDPKSGGGMLLAMGSHLVGLATYFSGKKVTAVDGFLSRVIDQVPDRAGGHIKQESESLFSTRLSLSSGAAAEIFCAGTSHTGTFLTVSIFGTEGTINFSDKGGACLHRFAGNGSRQTVRLSPREAERKENGSIYRAAFKGFVAEILRVLCPGSMKEPNAKCTTFNDYARQYEILEAIRSSSLGKKTVRL